MVKKLIFYKTLEPVDLLFCIVLSETEIFSIAQSILDLYNSSAGQFVLSQVITIIVIFFLAFSISFISYSYGIRGIFHSRTRITEEKLIKTIEILKECGPYGWVEKYENELTSL